MADIKELRDFGIQMLTIGCLTEPQIKRLCELIGNVCERIEELEEAFGLAHSMLMSGEKPSEKSEAVFKQALKG